MTSPSRNNRLHSWSLKDCLLLISCSAYSTVALATTDAEDRMKKSPMPHELLSNTGYRVKVHLTRLDGHVEGPQGNATSLAELKTIVQACVQQGPLGGGSPNPPKRWPDFVNSQRIDEYATANRTIRYTTTLVYGMNPADCSLLEIQASKATLTSSRGSCDIDLIEKTARGFCDTAAHANAPPPQHVQRSSIGEVKIAQRRAPSPALAALAAAMEKQPPGGTGVIKTILGLKCEVWSAPLDPRGTVCLSRGGSFVAEHATGEQAHSSMALELTSPSGLNMHAVEAKLDVMVNSAVFAPYLAAGFSISKMAARK